MVMLIMIDNIKRIDKLVIMLFYYRDYGTIENIAFDYGVAKSTICESIKWVENILIKCKDFFS